MPGAMPSAQAYRCHLAAWRLHKRELRAFLGNHAGSASAADDLLQEVFLRALRQGEAFCRLDHPRAWLFQVARHLLIDHGRLSRPHDPLPDDLAGEMPAAEIDAPAVDGLTLCLPRVLTELSAEDRQVLTLCDLQGMRQQDYARQFGLTLPAVKSRIQRARRRLQAQLVSACQVRFDAAGRVCCFTPRDTSTAR